MTTDLRFEFLVDQERSTITTVKEHAARRSRVWDCYTRSELLDRWFAPEPLTTKTAFMDFREGGHWHYAMVDPGGTEYWGRMDYQTIRPIDAFSALDGFCDAAGVLTPGLPRSRWDVTFTDADRHTLVRTVVSYASAADLEKVLQMGLQEGLASTLRRLDTLLGTPST